MTRYEVAVSTTVAFSPGLTAALFEVAEQVVIIFDGHRFVWHANGEEREQGEPCWPTVTVMVRDGDNYADECLATNRVLSAMSFVLDHQMSVVTSAASGFKKEFDTPILRQPGRSLGMVVTSAPSTVSVETDPRLRLVLALFREGRSADSPFYRFLAYFNAIDACFDNNEQTRDEFIRQALEGSSIPDRQPEGRFDWADYLRDTLRNAVAHAVRWPGKPVLDPDDLTDRRVLDQASETVARLVRSRVSERWPEGVQVSYGHTI